jgi:tRNA pseudouridine55 synthase
LEKLNRVGTLSYLERINEGAFFFDNEKDLDPLDYIDLPINNYFGTIDWLNTGKKISIDYLEKKDDGKYLIITDKFFSIIEIENSEVKYLLNKVNKV